MQHTQQRELPERMSWARAIIFAIGFFFLAAILVGQIPGFIYNEMTNASMAGMERDMLAFAALGIGAFFVINVIMMLFDPKPIISPRLFSGVGAILTIAGLALLLWAVFTHNQYFPAVGTSFAPILGGSFLWFQPQDVDFVMLGTVIFGVGMATIFYSTLAIRELKTKDRRDLGTTTGIRVMIVIGAVLLGAFMLFYTFVDDKGLAIKINSADVAGTQLMIDTAINIVLALAIFMALGAFALRLHYLMRPVRKRTMPTMYVVGINLAQVGALALVVWVLIYPGLAWIHTWPGLGDYLTICARKSEVPGSCFFSPQAGYIVDAILATNSFVLLMAGVWAWKTKRNTVVVSSVTIAAVLAIATLLVHMQPAETLIAMLLCGGSLIMISIWTSVARREFAVVGENNLGCIGQWLVVGCCLFAYIAAFAFFSIPGFHETEPNIPFVAGATVMPPAVNGVPVTTAMDAVVVFLLLGIIAGIHFYFLVRNRYRV